MHAILSLCNFEEEIPEWDSSKFHDKISTNYLVHHP